MKTMPEWQSSHVREKEDDQRVPVGLRIKRKTLNKAKATGKGYTGFLARLIDNAIDDENKLVPR